MRLEREVRASREGPVGDVNGLEFVTWWLVMSKDGIRFAFQKLVPWLPFGVHVSGVVVPAPRKT